MNGAFDIAAISLRAQRSALDILANNIANVNTPAFKRSDVIFAEVLTQPVDHSILSANLAASPALSSASAIARLSIDAQGEITQTGSPLDVAINGPGFLELMGSRGQTYLWRGGRLLIADDGLLAASNGMPLKAMINVPEGAFDIAIAEDGVVTARVSDGGERVQLGQIDLVSLDSAAAVERVDGGYYRLLDEGALSEAHPGHEGQGQLIQGGIERANVELAEEMIQLMIVQRAFAANAQVVQAADQIAAIANTLRR